MLQNLTRNWFSTLKISIQALKKLRQQTSAPMNQCQKALQQTQSNHELALKWLQEKGLLSAEKRLNKETRQGVVGCQLSPCRTKAVLVQVNCETDFVAKNQLFLKFVNELKRKLINSEEYLCQQQKDQNDQQINQFLTSNQPLNIFPQQPNKNMMEEYKLLIARLQQNVRIRRVITLHSDQGRFGSYVHREYTPGIGLQASLVEYYLSQELETDTQQQIFNQFADNMATQILGSPPKYLYYEHIPQQQIAAQTQKLKQQMKTALQKAPQHIRQNMLAGKMNAYYQQFLLPSMNYILSNDGQTVGQYWGQVESQLGKDVGIVQTIRWQCK